MLSISMHYLEEHHIFLFLVQTGLLLGLARFFGEIFRRYGQPAMTAEILVGVFLGPTVLGRFAPGFFEALFPPDAIQQAMLETMAWLGVLFLLLETGLEIDFSIAWRQRGSAMVIALADIVLPMVVAFLAVVFLPARYLADPDKRIIFSLFMATVMTISAMPVSARVFKDLKLLKTDMGFLTMSALAVNDIIGWVLFSIILGIFLQASVNLAQIGLIFIYTISFSALALTFGRRLSIRVFDGVRARGLPEPGTSLTLTCMLGLIFGSFTQWLGLHALFGFFIAGVVAGEAKSLSEDTRRVISQMVHSIFIPLFFANIGLKIDVAANFDWFMVGLITLIGVGGRYFGAWAGVRMVKVPRADRTLIAIAHIPGGMMEIVVALLALENNLITKPVFVGIVFSAVFSCVLMGPWAARALAKLPQLPLPDFLRRESVFLLGKVDSRQASIRPFAKLLARAEEGMSEAGLLEKVLLREEEYGTAIGGGLAIPHLRVEGLRAPFLGFARLAEGIDWNAPDGKPVRHVFFVASPAGADDVHVRILAAIGRIFSRPELVAIIDGADNPEALHRILSKALEVPVKKVAKK